MKSMRWVALAGLIALAAPGCSSRSMVKVQTEIDRPGAPIKTAKGQLVEGYTDAGGVEHVFDAYLRVLPGDSLEFFRVAHHGLMLEGDITALSLRVLRDSVSTVYIRHTNAAGTVFAIVTLAVLAVAVSGAIYAATKESCPFIYSWDGKRYVFDGEPYGGATMRALERTDWSELEHLTAERGRYRLLLTNEVDETQHTNRIALRVVDHPKGTRVVMDPEGRPHAFATLEPLAAARDESGRDLLRWLHNKDRAAWYPDLGAYARRALLVDTRNHITLEFARPPGATAAYLVADAATGQWGSHMIRTMLGMRGNRVQEFYAAVNGSEVYRQQLHEWNRREELFQLFIEVRRGDEWVRQGYIPGGGPFITESRAIPLDLTGVTGDRVQIRLNPPIGFWSLNSFHLAWDEAAVKVTEVLPEPDDRASAPSVVPSLLAADSVYLDFPNRGDRAEVTFMAPPSRSGMMRTVFAETRGWYEVHLHDLGAPDAVGITRLTFEPGYVVRRALQEYAEFERTGVLQGVQAVPAGAGGN